jgi:hypothetical protein
MSDFHTEELSKCNFYPLILREISVLTELHLGRMRYRFTYEPPQPNSPSEIFLHQDLSSKRQGIDAQQTLPDTQMGIVMEFNPGRGVRGLLHRTHRLSLSHPTYSFRGEGGPHAPTGAPHFLILMLEARGADEPRPPISSQCNERNNVQGGGISLSPEGSLLCYAPKIISQFKLESSSTGSSFPANLAKPVPFAVGSRARI